jgi:hypothetical protein
VARDLMMGEDPVPGPHMHPSAGVGQQAGRAAELPIQEHHRQKKGQRAERRQTARYRLDAISCSLCALTHKLRIDALKNQGLTLRETP